MAELIKVAPEHRCELVDRLRAASVPDYTYYVFVTLSTVIATYGLLAGSAAVVIGAMLIAPLMNPILGLTLALIRGDRKLVLNAVLAESIGVLVAICLAFLIGLVPLRPDFGPEILARTQPTLFDLLIAFFSGLAGAYASVNPKVSATIAGAAIATALVPPLAACGLCLSIGNYQLALGAFLLFFVNFLAIQFSAAIVFLLAGFDHRHVARPVASRTGNFLLAFGPGFVLLLLGVFLTKVLVEVITTHQIEAQVSSKLSDMLSTSQGAQLGAVKLDRSAAEWKLTAEVKTPQPFTPDSVSDFEDKLSAMLDQPLHLVLRSLITRDCDRNGPVFISDAERQGRQDLEERTRLLQEVSAVLGGRLREIPGAQLSDLRREDAGSELRFAASIQSPAVVQPEQVAVFQQALEAALQRPVKLVVRSIQTRDADSSGYLLTDAKPLPRTSPQEAALKEAIWHSLVMNMNYLPGGSSLIDLSVQGKIESPSVELTVRAPRAVTPAEVNKLQELLRTEVTPELSLMIHTAIAATADTEQFVSIPLVDN